MPKGISIHVGVNHTIAPEISVPPLKGSVNDAKEMHRLARAGGFGGPDPILEEKATYKTVTDAIREAAGSLKEGDSFMFTFSGHGTSHGSEDFDESDFLDETLVLHDALLIDNVFRRDLWPRFATGVDCVAISDSCFSEGVFWAASGDEEEVVVAAASPVGIGGLDVVGDVIGKRGGAALKNAVIARNKFPVSRRTQFREKTISRAQAKNHYQALESFYSEIRESLPLNPPLIKADLTLISACEENQRALDGEPNSFFTSLILEALKVNPTLSYQQLIDRFRAQFKFGPRRPNLRRLGNAALGVMAAKPAFNL